jgi:hypothetical protein
MSAEFGVGKIPQIGKAIGTTSALEQNIIIILGLTQEMAQMPIPP